MPKLLFIVWLWMLDLSPGSRCCDRSSYAPQKGLGYAVSPAYPMVFLVESDGSWGLGSGPGFQTLQSLRPMSNIFES